METKVEALSVVIQKFVNKEIMLPDFQRKFVWKEEDRQARLVASVLAKMPVGSILLLSSEASDYAYKMIGCKQRKTAKQLGVSGNILALLDGQQRMTVLTNAFSSTIFESSKQVSELINESLKRRFFLRIPKYNMAYSEAVEDFFKARDLDFPLSDPEQTEPDFLADEICEAIKVVPFNAGGTDCYNPYINPAPPKSELITYCTSGKEFLVPLYLLTGNNDTWLSQIIKNIANLIVIDIMDQYDKLEEDKKEEFVTKKLSESTRDLHDNNLPETREEFNNWIKEQGDTWADMLKRYLTSCLNSIQLNQIIVDNHKRARAINIYENLNKGGISLGTFELIMAKFASESTENYYEKILKTMKKSRNYDLIMYSNALERNEDVKAYIDSKNYIATIAMNCIDQKNDDIIPAYIDAYLNVMSLASHVPDYDMSKLGVDLIKKNKIMAISGRDLKEKCDSVCEALDKALFFFQMRCGIRNIKDLNYNLMLVVVAYILMNPKYRDDKDTYDYLDAWYWSAMFSGHFNSDQNERAVSSIRNLVNALDKKDASWIKSLGKQVFKLDFFSEKEFLLLNRDNGAGIYPKEFLRGVICEFYLAETYKGLFDESLSMNPFTRKSLEKHHVIPLGSYCAPDEKLSKSEEPLRAKREFFLNSPVNFVYITDSENNQISDDKLSDYQKRINAYSTKYTLGLSGDLDASTEDKCKEVLRQRFDALAGQVEKHIERLIP